VNNNPRNGAEGEGRLTHEIAPRQQQQAIGGSDSNFVKVSPTAASPESPITASMEQSQAAVSASAASLADSDAGMHRDASASSLPSDSDNSHREQIPYGMPAVKEVLRFLVSLLNPTDGRSTDIMRHLSLTFLQTFFLSGMEFIAGSSVLVEFISNEVCKQLFQVIITYYLLFIITNYLLSLIIIYYHLL
jgi:brefeldin A-resistance guanine nucleotide exchange factor 1